MLQSLNAYWSQITLVLFAIGYFIKQIIGYWFKLKEIRFNSLHLERAQKVRELYADLVILKQKLESMSLAHYMKSLDLGPTRNEWLPVFQGLIEQNKLIKDKFDANRVLFSKRFGSKMDILFTEVTSELILSSANRNVILKDLTKDLILNDSEKFKNYYDGRYKVLLHTLEKEFRKYL